MALLLKEYISTNHVYMIEGYLFNWRGHSKYGREPDKQDGLEILHMSFSSEGWKTYYISYYIKDKLLVIDGIKLQERDLESAEKTVMKFVKGSKLEIAPLYDKKQQTEFSNLVIINNT